VPARTSPKTSLTARALADWLEDLAYKAWLALPVKKMESDQVYSFVPPGVFCSACLFVLFGLSVCSVWSDLSVWDRRAQAKPRTKCWGSLRWAPQDLAGRQQQGGDPGEEDHETQTWEQGRGQGGGGGGDGGWTLDGRAVFKDLCSQLYGDLGEKNLVSKTCPDFVPAGIHTF
jgi:hypothetical protein